MLLVHQAGSVKVGEVVRYTLTYTPSNDRILPTPSHLHLRVKNTSAIPLRAAWVHGPYTLHVAAYPATFSPHHKVEDPENEGVPEYEPMVKAGGSWTSKLRVPGNIRETGADLGKKRSHKAGEEEGKGSVTWIIEIASQILFSNSASVGFEVLIGRDERSMDLGFAAVAGRGHGAPGQVKDVQSEKDKKGEQRRHHVQTEGVYSKAVRLVVEDTEILWDKPPLPSWDNEDDRNTRKSSEAKRQNEGTKEKKQKKRRNVHLVIVSHGLHSNLGADMLFLKESIDATVAQAREDARKRKAGYRNSEQKDVKNPDPSGNRDTTDSDAKDGDNGATTAQLSGGQEDQNNAPDEDDDGEETIVRGFPGNAVRTENGIQYLGKRLAKYILRFTYPDQPFLPVKKNLTRKLTDTFTSDSDKAKRDGKPSHQGSSIHTPREAKKAEELPYRFTSISFVGHSLGGLVQTYAVAYIHKHSPTFFQQIKPINFICLASPMLGLSNENPMYVKFALDFGLVGRTGQDLGLTWRPPTIANKGWNAMINGFTSNNQKDKNPENKQEDPSAKPLLRILPTGPAHQVLRMFRNRTVYSNVVNDGIVPLRTSCLLFLDWRGLGKVDKARRENGLIGTMAEWGWAELTGTNASSLNPNVRAEQGWESDEEDNEQVRRGKGDDVPLPAEDETAEDNRRSTNRVSYDEDETPPSRQSSSQNSVSRQGSQEQSKGMLDSFFSFFRPATPPEKKRPQPQTKKTTKALRRGQTIHHTYEESSDDGSRDQEGTTTSNPTMRPHMPHLYSNKSQHKRPVATRGDSLTNAETGEVLAPPKTSIFESAGDVLHPPLPSKRWLTDPSTRARTIFHDRVYHPEDIPPPPVRKRSSTRLNMSLSSPESSKASLKSNGSDSSMRTVDTATAAEIGGMKVEEKIARAYHRDLSWRKVLVRLEPDAHNNIIVRRMFANAYGWPVIKHLCDTHFADTYSARTRDEEEPARERAPPMDAPIDSHTGEEVKNQRDTKVQPRTQSETREARDELTDLPSREGTSSRTTRQESVVWDDSYFEISDGEDSDAVDERNLVAKILNPNHALPKKPEPVVHHRTGSASSTPSTPVSPTVSFTDGHRGLAPTSPKSPKSVKEVKASAPGKQSAKPTFDAGDVEDHHILSSNLVEEPQPLGSPTSMGLGKSVEEQMSPTKGKARPDCS